MQVGDVVFFDTYKKNGHVGIYLGNGKFMGSQSATGVAIADMNSGYWKQHFSGTVRRIGGGATSPTQSSNVSVGGSKPWINQQAGKFAPMFQAAGRKYGVDPSILMALSMQESSMGQTTGKNIMEANGGVAGGGQFNSYEASIDAGTREFAARYKEAGGDVQKALAAYNMGAGLLKWFDQYSGGKYSKDVVKQYSNYYAKKYGWRRYGDVNYVDNVLRYYK
jgi:soluble lytic murein transglycosylase-like protein